MPARLAITTEEGLCLELELSGRPVTVGRAEDNMVRSTDRRTSRHHARVRRAEGGGYEVEDMGSTYGVLLNGRAVQKGQRERLAHMDRVSAGGVQLQFLAVDSDEPDVDSDGPTGAFSPAELGEAERTELRGQVQTLIDEGAALRRELGRLEEALGRTEKERDAGREEVERLVAKIAEQRGELDRLTGRVEALGNDLRNARSGAQGGGEEEIGRLQRQLAEAQKQAERSAGRITEMEEKEAGLALKIQELKKETERLLDLNQKREKRESELLGAVKPALQRVAQLQDELEKTRIQMAQAQADLADYKKRGA